MHVLPLPFGLALALIPRREADSLGTNRGFRLRKTVHAREQSRRHQLPRDVHL